MHIIRTSIHEQNNAVVSCSLVKDTAQFWLFSLTSFKSLQRFCFLTHKPDSETHTHKKKTDLKYVSVFVRLFVWVLMPFLLLNHCNCASWQHSWLCPACLPETVCDGGILFYINRKVQKVLIFAAYLRKSKFVCVWCNKVKTIGTCCKMSCFQTLQEASYRFTRQAARLISQSALEDLVDPSGGRGGIAVVVLAVQCAVCEAAVGLFLLPLLLKQICNGV